MIININPHTFDILGQGLRNGDLIAVCNIIESIRQQRSDPSLQFYLRPQVLNTAPWVTEFYHWLVSNTDYFALSPSEHSLPWSKVMVWDYRATVGDWVKISNPVPQTPKVCVFPVYDAEYNTYRNWNPELLTKILLYCNVQYPNHEKILCAKDNMREYIDPCGFECSTDFLTNLNHLLSAEVYVGGDTGMSHFASVLDPGPRELVYYYSNNGMLHTLPFYSLEGKGTIVKFWQNFHGATFE